MREKFGKIVLGLGLGGLAAGGLYEGKEALNKAIESNNTQAAASTEIEQKRTETERIEKEENIRLYESKQQDIINQLVNSGIARESIKIIYIPEERDSDNTLKIKKGMEIRVEIPDSEKSKSNLKPEEYQTLVDDLQKYAVLISLENRYYWDRKYNQDFGIR